MTPEEQFSILEMIADLNERLEVVEHKFEQLSESAKWMLERYREKFDAEKSRLQS